MFTQLPRIAPDAAWDIISIRFSVFFWALLLGEPTQRQWIAIFPTVFAVAILTYEAGSLPWLSLILPISWGLYALFKRSLPIGPNQGFLLEVVALPSCGFVFGISVCHGRKSFCSR